MVSFILNMDSEIKKITNERERLIGQFCKEIIKVHKIRVQSGKQNGKKK